MKVPDFPSIAFPYDIDRLAFTGGTAGGSLTVALTLGTEEILSTTLTLDSAGAASLTDLGEFLNTRLEDVPATLSLAYTDGTNSGTLSTLLLPCHAPLADTAEEWVKKCPLTLTTGAKTCVLGEKQYFTLYGTGWTVIADEVITTIGDETGDKAGPVETKEADGLTYVELDWAYLDLCGDLPDVYAAGFTVVVKCYKADDNDQPAIFLTFHVIVPPYGSQTVLFRNAFAQWETLLFAAVTKKDKPTRTGGTFEGRYRNYLVENATTYEGVSFSLEDGELQTAGDFLEATTLMRSTDSVALALTDGELEASSTPDALPRLKATWREETRRPVRGKTPARIFDYTFNDYFE